MDARPEASDSRIGVLDAKYGENPLTDGYSEARPLSGSEPSFNPQVGKLSVESSTESDFLPAK